MATRRLGKDLHTLFVGNLPWTVGHTELRTYFQNFGRVVNANVIFNKKTGFSKGYGFVVYKGLSSIDKIESVPKHILEGNNLHIQKN